MSTYLQYNCSFIDRASEYRHSDGWYNDQKANPLKKVIPVWRGKNLIQNNKNDIKTVFFSGEDASNALSLASDNILLGLIDSHPIFTVDLSLYEQTELPDYFTGNFTNVRHVSSSLSQKEASLLAYATGILYWHSNNQYCGKCGSPTLIQDSGHLRLCTNSVCGYKIFPKIEPAVIMLIEHCPKNQRPSCLLARHSALPKGMFSTLAGFVEIGETLEKTVVREVYEEVGLKVNKATYQNSQPWPFPSSLMIGFWAQVADTNFKLNPDELEEAKWFSIDEISEQFEATNPDIIFSKEDSIARHLIETWCKTRQ